MIVYPAKQGTNSSVIFKLGFYIMLVTSSIIFLHSIIMRNNEKNKIAVDTNNEFIENNIEHLCV